jgi:hypothetical protein
MTEHIETPKTLPGYTVESRSQVAIPFSSSLQHLFAPTLVDSSGAGNFMDSSPAPYFSITTYPMADGVDGTWQACDAMNDAVMGRIGPDYSGFEDPWNVFLAEQITKNAHTPRAEVEAIWRFACGISYRPHPIDVQVVSDARRTVERGWADCVSYTVLICTLAMARGFACRYCVQYWSNEELFTHILPEVYVDGEWLACDAVAKDKPIDWLQPLPSTGFNVTWEIN